MAAAVINREAWEQQSGESNAAFSAFRIYLEMPAAERGILQAYRLRSGRAAAAKTPGWFSEWAANHDWPGRARLRDLAVERREREAVLEARLQRKREWVQRQEDTAEEGYQLALLLCGKAREMLQAATYKQRVTKETTAPDGRTIIQEITIEPVKFRLADSARMLEVADKLRRLAAEMVTERTARIDPAQVQDDKLRDASLILRESRSLYPSIDEQIRLANIANIFGVSVEQLQLAETAAAAQITTGVLVN